MTPINNGPPQKKRKLNPTPPQVTVQAVGADPRSRVPRIDPRTGTVPQTSSTPIIVRTSVPSQPPSDPRLPPNQQLIRQYPPPRNFHQQQHQNNLPGYHPKQELTQPPPQYNDGLSHNSMKWDNSGGSRTERRSGRDNHRGRRNRGRA